MNGPEPEWLLLGWLRLVRARWAATGVPRRDREALLQQLLRDLTTARAAGARIDELVATPPAVFADQCAAGLRSRHDSISTLGLLTVCLGTGVVATGAAWLFLLTLSASTATVDVDEGYVYLLVDLALIAAVLTAMVTAARAVYRRRPEIATLTPRLAVALTSATAIGFPLASLFGASQGYSFDLIVVVVEVLIVLAFLALGVITAQRWASLHSSANEGRVRRVTG